MNFSTHQINNLITGIKLSAEIQSSSPELRRFVTIAGYYKNTDDTLGGKKPDNILHSSKSEYMCFGIRDYEIPSDYIENDWDISEDELINSFHIIDIVGIKNAETELKKHISDFSILVPNWKCSNPI